MGDTPFNVKQIGVVHSPFETTADAPHQGFAGDAESTVELFEPYAGGLAGVEDVVRLTVVYWAHEAARSSLRGDDDVGVFARRSPNRPNPLSICPCLLLERTGRELRVRGLDAIDGSPVLDLKPALQGER